MTSPASDFQGVLPPDTGVRIGIARISGGVAYVEVSGTTVNTKFVVPAVTIDKPVVMLRSGATWVCLGGIANQPETIIPATI